MRKIIIYTCANIGLFIIFVRFNLQYSYQDLKDYLNVLLTVSSMVFTIMGIWIAFLYPNALHRITNPKKIEHVDFTETLSETRRLEGLVGSILMSAMVVLVIMFIFLFKVIISYIPYFIDYIRYIKAAAFSVVFVISILQVESVFYVIRSNILFINELHSKREEREADADI